MINPDIALTPVSGTYVMTAEEAAVAVNDLIRPTKMAIPMHYDSIVGTKEDAVPILGTGYSMFNKNIRKRIN